MGDWTWATSLPGIAWNGTRRPKPSLLLLCVLDGWFCFVFLPKHKSGVTFCASDVRCVADDGTTNYLVSDHISVVACLVRGLRNGSYRGSRFGVCGASRRALHSSVAVADNTAPNPDAATFKKQPLADPTAQMCRGGSWSENDPTNVTRWLFLSEPALE